MKVKGLVAVIIACVLTLCTVMPAFASSSFAVDQELSKTGTIYETVSFTSLSIKVSVPISDELSVFI